MKRKLIFADDVKQKRIVYHVNPENITYVEDNFGDDCVIHFVSGETLTVSNDGNRFSHALLDWGEPE